MVANIRQRPDAGQLRALLSKEKAELVAGLLAYRALLKAMYSDAQHLKGRDDDAKIKALQDAVILLYTCAAFGNLKTREDCSTIAIEKQSLLSRYKRGGLPQKIRLMGAHGFAAGWTDAEGESVPQSKADAFSIAFPCDKSLIPAMKHFADRIEALEPTGSGKQGRHYTGFSGDSVTGKVDLFGMADFAVAFGDASLAPYSVDPLREEVLAMAGTRKSAWEHLTRKLLDEYGLRCFGRTYLIGQWTISFHEKGKGPFLICGIRYDDVGVQLTVPVHAADAIIEHRRQYSPRIRKGLEGFGCVGCPKECKGKNLVKIEGLTMCTGRAEGRRIYLGAIDEDDFRSIEIMAELAFA